MSRRLPLPALLLALLLLPATLLASGPLRVGTNVWPGYEPLYLARELSAWNTKEIRLVEYPSASEVLRAFRNKAIEAAALTLDEVLVLRQSRVPVRVILVMDVSHGGDVIIARPGIQGMADLKGRRIAVESSALGAYLLTRALELHALPLSEVDITHLDVSAHEAAYREGRVDAAVTFDPVRTRLLQAGGREIFTSREIPGEIVDVLVVHEAFLQDHDSAVARLLAGWFQALDRLRTHPREAATIMARRLKLTPEEVLASYDGLSLPTAAENRTLLGGGGGSGAQLLPVLEKLMATMVEKQLLTTPVPLGEILDGSHLPTP